MIHRIVLFLKFAPSSEDFNRTFMDIDFNRTFMELKET